MTCPNCGSEKEPAGIQTLWCPDCGAEANLDDTAEFKTPEPQSNLDERIQQAKQQCIEARNLPDAERVAWLADYCRKAAEQMNKDRTDHMEERLQQSTPLKGTAPVPGLDGVPCIHGIPVVVEQKKQIVGVNKFADVTDASDMVKFTALCSKTMSDRPMSISHRENGQKYRELRFVTYADEAAKVEEDCDYELVLIKKKTRKK